MFIEIQEIINEYVSKGYTSDETLKHITKITNEILDNKVNLSNLMNLGQVYIDAEKTYTPLDNNALTQARNNLYNLYEIAFEDDERILDNTLYELSQYDKLIDYDGKEIVIPTNKISPK